MEGEFHDLVELCELIDKHMKNVDKLSSSTHKGFFKAISRRLCAAKVLVPIYDITYRDKVLKTAMEVTLRWTFFSDLVGET